jgi:hypothetical protein
MAKAINNGINEIIMKAHENINNGENNVKEM